MKRVLYLFTIAFICFSCNNSNDPERDYQNAQKSEAQLEEMENQYNKAKEDGVLTAELKEKLDKEYEEQFEKVKEAYALFYKNNINTPLGEEVFSTSRWTRRLNQDQLESVLAKAGDTFKATEAYQKNSERLHNMKTSVPGNVYKDIISKDPEGNEIALSEYAGKGKYVLLDFWASWCPPCREEMPNLVSLYEKYKDKNFELVGYSLDQAEDAWKNGIEKLNMTWPQMSDCEFWDSPAVKLYAVQSIPCTILIDPEGKIIERGLAGDNLSKKLESLINTDESK